MSNSKMATAIYCIDKYSELDRLKNKQQANYVFGVRLHICVANVPKIAGPRKLGCHVESKMVTTTYLC